MKTAHPGSRGPTGGDGAVESLETAPAFPQIGALDAALPASRTKQMGLKNWFIIRRKTKLGVFFTPDKLKILV